LRPVRAAGGHDGAAAGDPAGGECYVGQAAVLEQQNRAQEIAERMAEIDRDRATWLADRLASGAFKRRPGHG